MWERVHWLPSSCKVHQKWNFRVGTSNLQEHIIQMTNVSVKV